MKLAILQEAAIDDADYAQFHETLAQALNERNYETTVFTSRPGRWQNLEYLGPLCRAFSLQKYWSEIIKASLVYGSPLTVLPFVDAPITPVVAFHSVTEALTRALRYPDYGEETATLKRHIEEGRAVGLALDYSQEERYQLLKEAEEAVCQTNYPIVAATRNVKEDLLKYYDVKPNRVTIIPYGVEQSWFQNPSACAECDNRFNDINLQEPYLVFYAELRRGMTDFLAQGIDRLLEIFQRIRGLQKLVIITTDDPAYRPLFERSGAVIVENPSAEHLKHLFHHGGMYVQTARYESRNLPLLQAMASGLPVISFPVGLAEDIVETGKNGFVVQNLIQLIAKVDFLRGNRDKAEEFGHNASRMVKNRFSLGKSVEQYEKFFTELCR